MSLNELPPDMRPREKLLMRGAVSLSDSELLALLLRTGTKGRGVLYMAADVLAAFGGLSGLLNAGADDLKHIKGLGGLAKRAELLAVLELARRAIAERLRERPALDTAQALIDYVKLHLAQRPQEIFAVLFLDHYQCLITLEELSQGTLTQANVYPREVALRALHHQATAVVLAHNHPSGQVTPSAADAALTHTLQAALGLLDVRVLDHIIVAPGASFSMAAYDML
jgi:DNA repair protein RadC